jgi:septum formation protein
VTPVVLASASTTRARLLRDAGVAFSVVPASVDEGEIKASLRAENTSAAHIAEVLAELKAQRVSNRHRDALVIGADQTLGLGGALFDKPESRDAAREQLLALRGRTHELASACCVARAGAVIWREIQTARLTMRDFSESFLDSYLAEAGPEITASVGAYALEGWGAQLFARVQGDFFAVLGLPLLPLLECLRQNGGIPA